MKTTVRFAAYCGLQYIKADGTMIDLLHSFEAWRTVYAYGSSADFVFMLLWRKPDPETVPRLVLFDCTGYLEHAPRCSLWLQMHGKETRRCRALKM